MRKVYAGVSEGWRMVVGGNGIGIDKVVAMESDKGIGIDNATTMVSDREENNDGATVMASDREISIDEATAMAAMSDEDRRIIAVLRSLGDDVRLGIVRKLVLENRKLRSEEIIACTTVSPHSQPCMSYHFAKLVKAGVVLEEKRGTEKVYTLNAAYLGGLGIDVTKL